MGLKSYDKASIESYKGYLKNIALLSKLFSESEIPYLQYRTTEYLYCRVFGAKNISRSDVTIDAQKGDTGVGIKTFTYTGKRSQEKIAEFNKLLDNYSSSDDITKVKIIAGLRNERIDLVHRLYEVKNTIYHCVGRREGEIFVFEQAMPYINVSNIKISTRAKSKNVINFNDGKDDYSFNVSKSTLYKYFHADEVNTLFKVSVDMLSDPLESISKLVDDQKAVEKNRIKRRVVLPLYTLNSVSGEPYIPDKSGLNRWRADGTKRKRRFGEAEIGIRAGFRELVHSILPPRDTPFDAILPSGKKMTLKVSQQDGKALMSNPETALGLWVNREVLGLKKEEKVTYERLQELGVDSIELTYDGESWYLNFCKPGTFEEFIINN